MLDGRGGHGGYCVTAMMWTLSYRRAVEQAGRRDEVGWALGASEDSLYFRLVASARSTPGCRVEGMTSCVKLTTMTR